MEKLIMKNFILVIINMSLFSPKDNKFKLCVNYYSYYNEEY